MSEPIWIIGVGADGVTGLRPELRERLAGATWLAGGERHLARVESRAERFVIRDNVAELVAVLRGRPADARCVVLASGDPMFYGVGGVLGDALGRAAIRVEPAISSMQLAFARAGLSWQAAEIVSIHGRPLATQILPVLGRRRLGIFNEDGESPRRVAEFFADRGVLDYHAWLCEQLGTKDESVTCTPLESLIGPDSSPRQISPLNFLVLERQRPADYFDELDRLRRLAPGIRDREFSHADSGPVLLTHQEVRAVALAKLHPGRAPGGTIWDIGAGVGSVSIELALANPAADVVAVEKDAATRTWLERNRERFAAYNSRVLAGAAPDALEAEPAAPHSIFIGGSGGQLADILALCRDRLAPGGRLVANFVTIENLSLCLAACDSWQWPREVVQITVARSDRLADFTGLRPERSVWMLTAQKRARDNAP